MQRKLESEGMEVLIASSGAECLQIVPEQKPDLILLDVMMPLMDGMEVCRELKASEETRTIPIIFLTARDSKEGMIEGLAAGAADYITKPVDLEETLARVRAQLHYHELFKQNIELTHRLSEARRAAALGSLSQGISHNLNNLLGVVFGYLELAKGNVNKPEVAARHLDKVENAVVRMTRIIRQVTTVSTQMQLTLTRTEVARLVEGALDRFNINSNNKYLTTVVNHTEDATVLANVEVFEDAIGKLLENAWESYGTPVPDGSEVVFEISAAEREGRSWIQFSVHDRGNGLDPTIQDHVFEPFVSTKSTVGVGMGLTIARHGIRNLGGDVSLKARPGGGTTATFFIPVAESVAASAA